MKHIGGLNLLALLGAIATSVVAVGVTHRPPAGASAEAATGPAQAEVQQLTAVADARGKSVPVRDYRRIVSASIVADDVLWRLCVPGRIAAYTSRALQHPRYAHRYAGKPGLEGLKHVEEVLALKPDLVIMSHFADARHIARLEEHGIAVFDLGRMQGASSLQKNIRDIGQLLGNAAGGDALARRFVTRLGRVSAGLPTAERPRALYLSVYGTKLFGGTRGSSYHDVLQAAGLHDVAAAGHRGWPELTAEDVLSLAPELIITKVGMAPAVCAYPGLAQLSACQQPGRIIGVHGVLIDDPGLPMLEAAESLFELVHGARRQHGRPPTGADKRRPR